MENTRLEGDYKKDIQSIDNALRIDDNFDIVGKKIVTGDKRGKLYFIDGFIKDDVVEKILEYLMSVTPKKLKDVFTSQNFSENFVTYTEAELLCDINKICTKVLSGALALIIEDYDSAVIIDARTYPSRSVQEPEDDRVLRGSRDGFVETLIFNTALIRRRIRETDLTMQWMSIGEKSKTDIAVCYLNDKVDKKMLDTVLKKLKSVKINALTMGQESLAECLIHKQWYNPFSKIRYTERPDSAAACVLEGKIVVIVDNSPSVMLLPTTFFDFVQDTNDYYFPPLVGTYLRISRIIIFLLTLFLIPVWYLLIKNPDIIPGWLEFINVKEPNSVPVIVQLLILELVIDGIKLASLNTPSSLNNSFAVVGALVLGEFAIKARWFVPEVVLYMAFVAVANYTQPSFELGYAFKLLRTALLILTACFNYVGFIIGIIGMTALLATTKTVTGVSYLYPLFPFNKAEFLRLFIREPIDRKNN